MSEHRKHFNFYQNRECEYFPCHEGIPEEDFNCLFCYCPLYALGENCGGNFTYTAQGIKDCTNCLVPHRRENYLKVLSKMDAVLELARKKDQP